MKEERDTEGSGLGPHGSSCGYDGKGFCPVPHHKAMVVHRMVPCKSCLGHGCSPFTKQENTSPKASASFPQKSEGADRFTGQTHAHPNKTLRNSVYTDAVLGYHKAFLSGLAALKISQVPKEQKDNTETQ